MKDLWSNLGDSERFVSIFVSRYLRSRTHANPRPVARRQQIVTKKPEKNELKSEVCKYLKTSGNVPVSHLSLRHTWLYMIIVSAYLFFFNLNRFLADLLGKLRFTSSLFVHERTRFLLCPFDLFQYGKRTMLGIVRAFPFHLCPPSLYLLYPHFISIPLPSLMYLSGFCENFVTKVLVY